MITFNIYAVGNLKEKFWQDAENEYLKRLKRFSSTNVITIAEKNNESSIKLTLLKEGEDILKKIKGYIILLDRAGKTLSSEEFAQKIQSLSLKNSEISFIIGSSHGVSEAVKSAANESLSFGPATFPHNLARIMLLEQLYRAETILNNIKYHK